MIKDDELLQKYNEIWDKVSDTMKKGFDSEPVYNEKYLKTKIKLYEEKINTNFHGDKEPKEGSQCIYLSIDSVFRTRKSIPQVFLEECKYIAKEKGMSKYFNNDMKKILMKKVLMKKVLMKKILMNKIKYKKILYKAKEIIENKKVKM